MRISLAHEGCGVLIESSHPNLYIILAHVRKGSFVLLLPTNPTEVLKASQVHDNVMEIATRTRFRPPLNDCDGIV